MNEQTENVAQAAPAPSRRTRRRRTLLAALVLILVPIAVGTAWVVNLPPGMGPLSALRNAGLPMPTVLLATFEPQSLPNPLDEIPTLDLPSPEPTTAFIPDPLAADTAGGRLSAIEGTLSAHEVIQRDLTERLETLAEGNARMAAELASQAERLVQLEATTTGIIDSVAVARREAQLARSLVETTTGEREARLELVETDVFALANALKTSRAVSSSLSERIDALAADLHLVARFGVEQTPSAPQQPSTTITTAPFQSNYHASATDAARDAPPAVQPVQGQYRVGDWMAGWGVVSSIRRTPEGDHLTTPRGIVFAPPAVAEE